MKTLKRKKCIYVLIRCDFTLEIFFMLFVSLCNDDFRCDVIEKFKENFSFQKTL